MRILCIGDSLTYGTGSTPGHTYPEVLQQYLGEYCKDVIVVNDGQPGYSTKDYWDSITAFQASAGGLAGDAAFARYGVYDAIVILLGCNDCRLDNWVETKQSMAYLSMIVGFFKQRIRSNPGSIFICTTLKLADPMPPDIIGGQHPWRQSKVEDEMNPGIKQVAMHAGIGLIDVYSAFQAGLDEGAELYDGIHPFDSGYQLIAETIGKRILSVLSKTNEEAISCY